MNAAISSKASSFKLVAASVRDFTVLQKAVLSVNFVVVIILLRLVYV